MLFNSCYSCVSCDSGVPILWPLAHRRSLGSRQATRDSAHGSGTHEGKGEELKGKAKKEFGEAQEDIDRNT
jgi:hypothetical protein